MCARRRRTLRVQCELRPIPTFFQGGSDSDNPEETSRADSNRSAEQAATQAPGSSDSIAGFQGGRSDPVIARWRGRPSRGAFSFSFDGEHGTESSAGPCRADSSRGSRSCVKGCPACRFRSLSIGLAGRRCFPASGSLAHWPVAIRLPSICRVRGTSEDDGDASFPQAEWPAAIRSGRRSADRCFAIIRWSSHSPANKGEQ